MNKLLRLLGVGAIALATLAGCKEYRTDYSEVKHEMAVVMNKRHIKESYLNPVDNINPMRKIDPLFDFKKGRLVTKTNEQYNITFNGSVTFKFNNKDLYGRFNEGDLADVSYRDIYLSVYDDTDGDGTKELIKRTLEEHRFIDAQQIKK